MLKNFKKINTGFSLVETLVAISILSISIMATFTAVQAGLKESLGARDQITAFYLAQEGMEFIKNVRDNNALVYLNGGSSHWLGGLSQVSTDPCYFGKVCSIDSAHPNGAPAVSSCGTASIGNTPPNLCPVLKQDISTGLFGYTSGWVESRFKREVQLQSINDDEINVIISISWTDRGETKFFIVSEVLFNRQ